MEANTVIFGAIRLGLGAQLVLRIMLSGPETGRSNRGTKEPKRASLVTPKALWVGSESRQM